MHGTHNMPGMEGMNSDTNSTMNSTIGGTMNSTMDMGAMTMHMSFFWGKNVTILVSSWTTETVGQYIAALIAVFLFCILHEFLTTLRVTLISNAAASTAKSMDSPVHTQAPLLKQLAGPVSLSSKLIGSSLYGVNVASAYVLMLVVMTFNVGLLLAIVLGLTAGFLLFGFGRCTTTTSELCCAM